MRAAIQVDHPPNRLVLEQDRNRVVMLDQEEGERRRQAA